ncbi:MAG: HEAT repeat domain-containing protein [Thermoanaerobaculia bacterium]
MTEAVLFLLFLGASLGYNVWQSRQRLQGWQDAAVSCGLKVAEASSALSPKLTASAGPVQVRMETCGNKGRLTRIMVDAPEPQRGFRQVMIRPESLIKWGREIEVGDELFDRTFFIEGPPQLVFAVLDAELRRLLGSVKSESRLEISSGELRAEMSDEKVGQVLPLLLDVSQRFAQPLDVPRRLAENANQDPEPGVRLQNLLLLIRELPDDPATAEALRKACSDPSPGIRLRAAKEVGAEARATLLELAGNLQDDAVSAEAVSILDRELPYERTRAILVQAMSLHCVRTARACLEALGRSGAAAAIDKLVEVLASKDIELAPAAAQALGAIGSPAAEPPLIQALQRDDADIRVAAANALGRVGSAAAVLPLKEIADRFLLGETRRAAHQAIAEIQSRLQGATPGQLSLAGAEAGQLSLAQGEGGRLSLADDPAGPLSISGDDVED